MYFRTSRTKLSNECRHLLGYSAVWSACQQTIQDIICPETLVHIRTTRRYIPEDGDIHNHSCQDLKSYITEQVGREVSLLT
jgi:hypothetical protein